MAALIMTLCSYSQNLWQLDTLAPLPMLTSNNSVVEGFIDGRAYVYSFAGIDESKIYSGIHLRSFRLDVEADTWEELDPLPDPNGGKIACSASRVGDIIYIIGGYHVASNGSEVSSSKVHRYDIISNTFLSDGTDIPVPIDDQSQIVIGADIYVISGWSNFGNVRDVQIYNTETDTWKAANSLPNTNNYKVFGSAGAVVGDTLFYYGGAGGTGFASSRVFRKGALNSDCEISWVSTGISEFSYRPAATTISVDDRQLPVWIGGSDVSYNYDGVAYNGSGGVSPSNRIMLYNNALTSPIEYFDMDLPMDLRSVASIGGNTKIIVGGMESGQTVSDKTLRLTYTGVSSVSEKEERQDLSISPIPASNNIDIDAGPSWIKYLNKPFKILDSNGQVVKFLELTDQFTSLATDDLAPGIYILLLEDQAKQFIIGR